MKYIDLKFKVPADIPLSDLQDLASHINCEIDIKFKPTNKEEEFDEYEQFNKSLYPFLAMDHDGEAWLYNNRPVFNDTEGFWEGAPRCAVDSLIEFCKPEQLWTWAGLPTQYNFNGYSWQIVEDNI